MDQIHLNTAVLFSVIGFLICATVGGGWWTIWRVVTRLEKKFDDMSLICRERLPDCLQTFVSIKDFDDWKEGRDPIWKALNHHSHSENGRVIRED